MNAPEALGTGAVERICGALGDHLLACVRKSARRVYIDIPPEFVIEVSRLMFAEIGARLQTATGFDAPTGIEVMYHWALDREDCVVTIRAIVEREQPVLDSITGVCPAAEWIEREMWELLGIEFRGHPDLRHLLLDDHWPKGDYPLRRDRSAARRPPTGKDLEPGHD